jgi:predicted P-loop ATPase
MLILYSKNQHIGKTELVKKISCGTGSFTQKSLDTRNKDAMMTIYSNWIYEYGELGTQFRKNDINTLKSFITDSAVSYRRPYDREATLYPVRTSIIGTTNEEDLFVDPSGNRRYLIITCNWTRADWPAINAIDFVQLWRQARVEWMEGDDYILSLEDQRYNETRCMNKRVITTEMYAIIDAIIAAKKSGFKGLYRIDEHEGKVIINLLGLLKMVKDQWRDAKMYNLTRELEAMGFKRDRNRLGDNFIIDKEAFEIIVAGRQTPVP